jgi:hypothetical protein
MCAMSDGDKVRGGAVSPKRVRSGAASPKKRNIGDLASFNELTNGNHAVAGLYCYMHLDVLIELARLIALDFFARPVVYRDERVGEVARELAEMHARYGCDEFHLAEAQRRAIFASLFSHDEAFAYHESAAVPGVAMAGEPVGEHFAFERDQLLAASAAFAERVFNSGERPLRDTVGVFAPGLRSWLADLNHAMVQWVRNEALARLTEDTCYKILRNPGIAAAHGMDPPTANWPWREEANGTALVAEVSNRLGLPAPVTREGFIDRQRLALRGAEAIATLLDFPDGVDMDEDSVDRLISKSYTWYAARGRALGVPLATVAITQTYDEMSMAAVDGARRNRGLFIASPASP